MSSNFKLVVSSTPEENKELVRSEESSLDSFKAMDKRFEDETNVSASDNVSGTIIKTDTLQE